MFIRTLLQSKSWRVCFLSFYAVITILSQGRIGCDERLQFVVVNFSPNGAM